MGAIKPLTIESPLPKICFPDQNLTKSNEVEDSLEHNKNTSTDKTSLLMVVSGSGFITLILPLKSPLVTHSPTVIQSG